MFTIQVKNIQIPMYLGIYEWEKTHLRNIKLSLTISCLEDMVGERVCYDEICQYLEQYHYQRFDLIEDFVQTLGNSLLNQFSAINKTTIKITKGLSLRGQPSKVSIKKKFEK